jgi:proline iminopeptidase
MTTMKIRDVSLYVEVIGQGPPLLLMHGGPGLDHMSLTPFRRLADEHTVVFYDHRCNGRSTGAPVTSMTWDNLTADADALREVLGFEQWAVLGHSFGGQVALEYALRYPERVSRLVLLDTAGDVRWSQEHAAEVLAERGFSQKTVAVARRFYNGRVAPNDFVRAAIRLLPAYDHRFSFLRLAREMLEGGWRMKARPEALTFGGHMMQGWSVMDRLGEIRVPTLVIAGHDDFLFPPQSQALLAAGIPKARLRIIERAGHNPQSERPAETLAAVADFLAAAPGLAARRQGPDHPHGMTVEIVASRSASADPEKPAARHLVLRNGRSRLGASTPSRALLGEGRSASLSQSSRLRSVRKPEGSSPTIPAPPGASVSQTPAVPPPVRAQHARPR